MAEYIERSDAADYFEKSKQTMWHKDDVAATLSGKSIPAADVVEVRQGYWKYYECVSSYDGIKSGYACSVCSAFVDEEIFDMDEFHKDFCGACGAKMDGKGEGE